MTSIPDSARAVLGSSALAHLVTLNPDGTARITEGGAAEKLQELARTYLGPDVKFPPVGEPALTR
jgi:hypothetical protein